MNTILRTRLFALGIAHLMAWTPESAAGADPARPNVIVIMADDLGAEGLGYDIPVTSDKERYSKKVTTDPAHEADRHRFQSALDQFMAIKSEISPKLKGGTKSKTSKGKPD